MNDLLDDEVRNVPGGQLTRDVLDVLAASGASDHAILMALEKMDAVIASGGGAGYFKVGLNPASGADYPVCTFNVDDFCRDVTALAHEFMRTQDQAPSD